MNKTLGEKQFNIDKGNRIPFDAFSSKEDWEAFKVRVRESKLPPFKKRTWLLRIEDVLGDDFSERIRDSAYIAREARDFLMKLFKKPEGRHFLLRPATE